MTRLHAPDPAAVEGTRIPVRIKLVHRASFVYQLLNHLPAVYTVVVTGASALQVEREGGGRVLAAAELLVGAWMLLVIGREAWHLFGRRAAHAHAASHESTRIDVPNLASAALGYVEAWHHAHVVGHFKLLSPYIVGGTMSLLLAIGGRRALEKRRQRRLSYIAVTPAGMAYKAGPRTSWRAAWTDVAAVEYTRDEIAVRLHTVRRRVLRAAFFFDGEALLAETRAAIAAYAPPHLAGSIGSATSPAPTPHKQDTEGITVQ
ncbi:MAG TPA: hypothetical protein VGJ18_14825 [Gemmatimonadaceae bacterium]|jgi:hypothetical protein